MILVVGKSYVLSQNGLVARCICKEVLISDTVVEVPSA